MDPGDSFHHTHLAFYLVGSAAALAVFHDSAQVRV